MGKNHRLKVCCLKPLGEKKAEFCEGTRAVREENLAILVEDWLIDVSELGYVV